MSVSREKPLTHALESESSNIYNIRNIVKNWNNVDILTLSFKPTSLVGCGRLWRICCARQQVAEEFSRSVAWLKLCWDTGVVNLRLIYVHVIRCMSSSIPSDRQNVKACQDSRWLYATPSGRLHGACCRAVSSMFLPIIPCAFVWMVLPHQHAEKTWLCQPMPNTSKYITILLRVVV